MGLLNTCLTLEILETYVHFVIYCTLNEHKTPSIAKQPSDLKDEMRYADSIDSGIGERI